MGELRVMPAPKGFLDNALFWGPILGIAGGVFWLTFVAGSLALFGNNPLWPVLLRGLIPGMIMGLVFGIFAAIGTGLHFRTNIFSIDFVNKPEMLARIKSTMKRIKYALVQEKEDYLVFRPTLGAGIASPKIHIHLFGDRANIYSPVRLIKKIQKGLANSH